MKTAKKTISILWNIFLIATAAAFFGLAAYSMLQKAKASGCQAPRPADCLNSST